PRLPAFPMADMVAARAGASAGLAALRHRDQVSGVGQVVDISLYEPLALLGPDAARHAIDGTVRTRQGNRSDNASPRGTYRTRDGKWVALSASTPASAAALFKNLGLGHLLDDPRFATNDSRVANNDLVDEALTRAIGARTLAEMQQLFEASDLTASPIYDIADIAKDPHVTARGILLDVPDPELGGQDGRADAAARRHAGRRRVGGPGPRRSQPARVRRARPLVGRDRRARTRRSDLTV